MIIYGWNTKTIQQSSIEYECKSCGDKNAFLAIFAHYAHVFWIPFFPYKKSATIVCSNCANAVDESFLKNENKEVLKRFKSDARIPAYLFSGVALVALFVGFLVFKSYANANLKQTAIDNPQIGDVFLVLDPEEESEYNLYFLKVKDIVDDSLWVSPSSYSYSRTVSKLEPEDGFYNAMYTVHKNFLQELDQSGELKKVFRDYGSKTGFEREVDYESDLLISPSSDSEPDSNAEF